MFAKSKVITAAIKCAHGINPRGIRMSMINKNKSGYEYLRCSEDKTWEYDIKCNKNYLFREN